MATTLPNTGAIIPAMTEAPDQAVNNAAFTAIDVAMAGAIHFNKPVIAPYNRSNNLWRDLAGIGFYYVSTQDDWPAADGLLLHVRHPATALTFQMFFGSSGQIWTRRITAGGDFGTTDFTAV